MHVVLLNVVAIFSAQENLERIAKAALEIPEF